LAGLRCGEAWTKQWKCHHVASCRREYRIEEERCGKREGQAERGTGTRPGGAETLRDMAADTCVDEVAAAPDEDTTFYEMATLREAEDWCEKE